MGLHLSQMTEKEFAESDRILLRMGNKVIDATDFIFSHPGGESAIRNTPLHILNADPSGRSLYSVIQRSWITIYKSAV